MDPYIVNASSCFVTCLSCLEWKLTWFCPTLDTPAPAEGEAPPAEEVPADGEVIAEPPPAPKKKPKYFIHWDRKKPKFYDYNFDYGESYYSPVVGYLDNKNLGKIY